MPVESSVYEIMASIANVVIAFASVAAAKTAYDALSIWKKEHEAKITYEIATRCIRDSQLLFIEIEIERVCLQITDIDNWHTVSDKSKRYADIFAITALEAQRHFGEGRIGPIIKKISDILNDFYICARIYPFHKSKTPLNDLMVKKLKPEATKAKYNLLMKKIFESGNPMEDEYHKNIKKAFDDLEEFLIPYVKMTKY